MNIDQLEIDCLQNSYINEILELTLDDIKSLFKDKRKEMNINSILINNLISLDTTLNEIYLDTALNEIIHKLNNDLDYIENLNIEYHDLMYRWYQENFFSIEHHYIDIEKDEYMDYEDIIIEMECRAGYISFENYIDNIIDIILNDKLHDVDYIENSIKALCSYKYIL